MCINVGESLVLGQDININYMIYLNRSCFLELMVSTPSLSACFFYNYGVVILYFSHALPVMKSSEG